MEWGGGYDELQRRVISETRVKWYKYPKTLSGRWFHVLDFGEQNAMSYENYCKMHVHADAFVNMCST